MSSYSSWTRKEPTPEPGRQGPRVGSWCLQPTRTHTGPLRPQLSSPPPPNLPFPVHARPQSWVCPEPSACLAHRDSWAPLRLGQPQLPSCLPTAVWGTHSTTSSLGGVPAKAACHQGTVFTLALCRTGSHPCSCSSCLVALTPLLYLVEGVDGTQPCTRPSARLGPAPTPHRAWLCPASPCIPAWAHEAAAPAHRLVSVRPAHAPAPKPSREEGPRPTPAPSAAPLAPNWTLRIEPSVSPRPAHWRWQRGTLPQIPQTHHPRPSTGPPGWSSPAITTSLNVGTAGGAASGAECVRGGRVR